MVFESSFVSKILSSRGRQTVHFPSLYEFVGPRRSSSRFGFVPSYLRFHRSYRDEIFRKEEHDSDDHPGRSSKACVGFWVRSGKRPTLCWFVGAGKNCTFYSVSRGFIITRLILKVTKEVKENNVVAHRHPTRRGAKTRFSTYVFYEILDVFRVGASRCCTAKSEASKKWASRWSTGFLKFNTYSMFRSLSQGVFSRNYRRAR